MESGDASSCHTMGMLKVMKCIAPGAAGGAASGRGPVGYRATSQVDGGEQCGCFLTWGVPQQWMGYFMENFY